MILTIEDTLVEVNFHDSLTEDKLGLMWYAFLNSVIRNRGEDTSGIRIYDPEEIINENIVLNAIFPNENGGTKAVLQNYRMHDGKKYPNPYAFLHIPPEHMWKLVKHFNDIHRTMPDIWPKAEVELVYVRVKLSDNPMLNELFLELTRILSPMIPDMQERITNQYFMNKSIRDMDVKINLYKNVALIWIPKKLYLFKNLEFNAPKVDDKYNPGVELNPKVIPIKPQIETLLNVGKRALSVIRDGFELWIDEARKMDADEQILNQFMIQLDSPSIVGIDKNQKYKLL